MYNTDCIIRSLTHGVAMQSLATTCTCTMEWEVLEAARAHNTSLRTVVRYMYGVRAVHILSPDLYSPDCTCTPRF